jgi:DnaJ-domain-containing protein 1
MQQGIAQLEQLFSSSKGDDKVLKQLEQELRYRQVPRAVALLAEVQAALYAAKQPFGQTLAPRAAAAPLAQPPESTVASVAPIPPVNPRPVPVFAPLPATNGAAPTPTASDAMGVDEAYKVLKATPGSPWESIEKARRELVQLAHPEQLASLGAEKRARLQAEAKRVNTAYALLRKARSEGP